ncbi:DUF4386 domain-containing protein [Muriicola sp. Z0-33]|uniref:DUF4386 domain-containing protein n=1 Tax=Muriicola sp. Z0-33 TaxID=2816957 RepID=UPI0022371A9E|nr:DUF4386 domain-containing protein [Muriicola sp. Z0-33]MCW5516041.1 DUF4386 domain-containing protein [Muriicola sp. Z0-33]
MRNIVSNLSSKRAAVVVGVAFITSVFIVTIVDDFLLANFVVPGDTAALANDIKANSTIFAYAVIAYLIVLVLDAIIGLALYAVLKSANEKLALFTAVLRLLYACTLVIALLALVFQLIDVYDYAAVKLIGYIFFALHILVLGYSVFKSGYIPKPLGIVLIVASFTYIVFFVDINLPELLMVSTMLIMGLAELLLSIWLIVKRNKIP